MTTLYFQELESGCSMHVAYRRLVDKKPHKLLHMFTFELDPQPLRSGRVAELPPQTESDSSSVQDHNRLLLSAQEKANRTGKTQTITIGKTNTKLLIKPAFPKVISLLFKFKFYITYLLSLIHI